MKLEQKLLTLLRHESVTGNEGALCDFLEGQLGSLTAYHCDRIGDSFALRPRQRSCPQLVALVGHLDTVPPSAPNPPRVEGDRVYGTGAADMKSGVALMWHLLTDPPASPAYDVAYIFYSGEEGPYDGSGLGPLLERIDWLRTIDLAICLEPSDNVVQVGCMGTLHAEVGFMGRAAHSARPWQGHNAIHEAAGLLTRLAVLSPQRVVVEGFDFDEVVSATTAAGGRARNMVPDSFVINLNYRFAPGRSIDSAKGQIVDLVAGEAEIVFVDVAPAGDIPPSAHPVLERLKSHCGVPVKQKQAWTDVARFTAAGIAAINFGPGENAQAHQPDESTSLKLLDQGEQLFRQFLSAIE